MSHESSKPDTSAERRRLETIADFYHSSDAVDAVDHFHLHLRDVAIPEGGGRSALELGCGSGRWTKVLCDLYARVDVVDASGELVDRVLQDCAAGVAEIEGHVALIEDFLHQAARRWHHVYLTMLLEHVADPVAIMSAARHVCDDDGTLIIVVPNANSVHREIAVRAGLIGHLTELSASDHKVGHRRVYTKDALLDDVAQAGFRSWTAFPIGLKPITHEQMKILPDSVLWALCRSGDLVPENPAYWLVEARA
jgi:2-polyprenyl-3-methyl-5-hydroxy-6-metoxy-1,4-benzoquinol methylase